jgi:lysophospholipase L1-like esterase
VERGSGHYSQWAQQIAATEGVQFLDLTAMMADKFDAMGEENVKLLYPRDHTHFNAVGADMHAAAVVSLLKNLHPNPVEKFLSAKGEAVQANRPTPGKSK